jgi:aryl-alcohol dehydrogenase (NADP+)
LEDTLRFLDDAVSRGKIAYYGFSNFLACQLTKAVHVARARGWHPPVSLQPQYSLLLREIESEIVPGRGGHRRGGVYPYGAHGAGAAQPQN